MWIHSAERAAPMTIRFGLLLQSHVPGLQQPPHVARREEVIRQPAEEAQRRAVLPLVHHACATLHGLKGVPVLEGGERAMHLNVP